MKSAPVDLAVDTVSCFFDVVEHLRQIYVEAIDYSATTGPGMFHGNVIGVLDQLDVRRRCWKVGQIVIDERWRQNSSLYHSCFQLSAFTFFLPKKTLARLFCI